VPLVQCVVCLSSSVVVCDVVSYCGKTVHPSQKLSEGVNRKPGSKSWFFGRRHISTSGFAATATETAVFAVFLPVQPSNQYKMVEIDFLAANHVRIVGLCGQNWNQTLGYSFALRSVQAYVRNVVDNLSTVDHVDHATTVHGRGLLWALATGH